MSDEFWTSFAGVIETKLTQDPTFFNRNEISKIFYAFSIAPRTPELEAKKILLSAIPGVLADRNVNWAELQNISYGLLYYNITDEDTLREFTKAVSFQKYPCSTYHYQGIKYIKYFMDSLGYNEDVWDFKWWTNLCFHAENDFNVMRLEAQSQKS
jgi:hypothetical protein